MGAEQSSFEEKRDEVIKANIRMISGCEDVQTSADVSNVRDFSLPDPAGRAGGACTSALLQTLYADEQAPEEDLSFVETLEKVREILSESGFSQVPQLSSSSSLNVTAKFDLVPEESEGVGTKRAVIIGINYVGQDPGELRGCHNDALNMKKYIMDVHGFPEENIVVLMDDGEHEEPNRDNIINAYRKLVEDSEEGDCVFCHFSGHGGKLRDDDGDEEDGYDETLIPVDYREAGQIRDDDLFEILVRPMPAGVTMTCLFDCCHSGTVLDLPYKFTPDGSREATTTEFDETVNVKKFFDLAGVVLEEVSG